MDLREEILRYERVNPMPEPIRLTDHISLIVCESVPSGTVLFVNSRSGKIVAAIVNCKESE